MDEAAQVRSFYDSIDAAAIDRMIANKTSEDATLDYKRWPQSAGDLSRLLKKAVSGYANSAGGVVLLGVEGEKVGTLNMPFAKAVTGVPDAKLEQVHLLEAAKRATEPGVDGLAVDVVSHPRGDVLKLLVPPSLEPIRSNEDSGQYYQRVNDEFVPMRHWQIANAFARKASPRLELRKVAFEDLKWREPQFMSRSAEFQAHLVPCIHNVGMVMARQMLIEIAPYEDSVRLDYTAQHPASLFRVASKLVPSTRVRLESKEGVLHSSDHVHLCILAVQCRDVNRQPLARVGFEYRLFAAGMLPVSGSVSFDPTRLLALCLP